MSESLYLNNGNILTVSDIMKPTIVDSYDSAYNMYGLCANEETVTWLDLTPYVNDAWEDEFTPDHPYGWINNLKTLLLKEQHIAAVNLALNNGAFIWGNISSGGLYLCRRSAGVYDLYMFCGYAESIADPDSDKYYIHSYPTLQGLSYNQLKAVAVVSIVRKSATTGELLERTYNVIYAGDSFISGTPATSEAAGVAQYDNPLDDKDITSVSYLVSGSKMFLTDTFKAEDYYAVNPINPTYVNYTVSQTMYVQEYVDPLGVDSYVGFNISQSIGERGYADDPAFNQSGSWWGGDDNKTKNDPNKGPVNSSGGGFGTPSKHSDDMGFPDSDQFAIDATTCGFVTIFHPTAAEMLAFNQWLFASFTQAWWDSLKKILQDPLDFVIGAGMIKYIPTQKAASQEIYFNGISTGCFSETVNQWDFMDFGTVEIAEQYESYLDFNGYSDIKIYLPFCGIHSLDINDCMGAKLHLRYYLDNLTGACVALINVDREDRGEGDDSHINSVLYKFTGNAMQQLPLYAKDYTDCLNALANLTTTAVTAASTGTIGMAGTSLASNASHLKPSINRSGNLGSNFGMMDNLTPYVILERPIRSIPADFGSKVGYPCAKKIDIGNCSGYTKALPGTNWAENIPCSKAEKDEIQEYLTDGIIIENKYNDYPWEV